MSEVRANSITNAAGTGAPDFPNGLTSAAGASLASPALTGTPTAPTAAVGTNTTQVATTAFVNAEIANDAPTKTGGGASGTWGINVTGSAGSTAVLNQVANFPTANGQDFNSLTTGGYYNIVWGNFSGILNGPIVANNSYGTLLVQAGNNFISQLYMSHSDISIPVTRVFYNGSWTSWSTPSLTISSNPATTSGTFFDFGGIPSNVREIEVYWQNVRVSDASDPAVQLIVGGSPIASGYQSSSSSSGADSNQTTGFHMYNDQTARYFSGIMRLVRAASGVWSETHSIALGGADASGGGWISGVGVVDGIRVTRIGAGTFIQGNVSISYR